MKPKNTHQILFLPLASLFNNVKQKKIAPKSLSLIIIVCLILAPLTGCSSKTKDDTLTLRICNWEEYIDEGDWDDDEAIDLENQTIMGKNSMIDDFVKWYKKKYNKKIKVEYSCTGTNEELYNQLTLGDTFDLICPSEYMIMKLMEEHALVPYSDSFKDTSNPDNYYANGLSPYIKDFINTVKVSDESIDKYAAGYMWGTTGIVYNPEIVSDEDAQSWNILINPDYAHQITIKDNVRDSYFAGIGIYKSKELCSLYDSIKTQNPELSEDSLQTLYHKALTKEMNDTTPKTITAVQNILQKNKNNFYSFETDSGKSDMITGKVVANYQWSGDGVFALDQADEDDFELRYAVPKESSNLWFDGWVMLKKGIGNNKEKQQACEDFINFISRPDNVVRNMYYIGYTSVISGGEDTTIYDYANWCYGAEDEEEETAQYPIGYFFTNDKKKQKDYMITTTPDQFKRQLFAQYPTKEVLDRCSIMEYFGPDTTKELNQMWINVRCFNPF